MLALESPTCTMDTPKALILSPKATLSLKEKGYVPPRSAGIQAQPQPGGRQKAAVSTAHYLRAQLGMSYSWARASHSRVRQGTNWHIQEPL